MSHIISLIQIETRKTSFNSWSEFQNNRSSICSSTKIASVTLHYPTENCPAAQRHKTIGIHNKFSALKRSQSFQDIDPPYCYLLKHATRQRTCGKGLTHDGRTNINYIQYTNEIESARCNSCK